MDLPVELIDRIFSFVTSNEGLRNLALCSRQFNDIVTPRLYYYVDLRNNDEYKTEKSTWDYFKHLRPLTCLFLRRPSIAACVKQLTMRSSFDESYGKEGRLFELEAEISDAITKASDTEEEAREWLNDASHVPGQDAVLAVMLSTLVQLRSLDLVIHYTASHVPRQLTRMGQTGKPNDSSMQMLRNVLFSSDDTVYGMLSDNVDCLFTLPAIQNIYLFMVGDPGGSPLPKLEPKSSNVASIELRRCKLSTSNMYDILCAARALKSFSYELFWGRLSTEDSDLTELRSDLDMHAGTLEELSLQDCGGWDAGHWDSEDRTPMRSFSNFSALRHIQIATLFLFGEPKNRLPESACLDRLVELLPAQIESIRLIFGEGDTDLVLGAVRNLIFHKIERFKSLSSITLELKRDITSVFKSHVAGILPLGPDNGIAITLLEHNGERVERKWGFDENVEWAECEGNETSIQEVNL